MSDVAAVEIPVPEAASAPGAIRFYREVFEKSPVPKLVYRLTDYQILAANQGVCRVLGYSATELVRKTVQDLLFSTDWHRLHSIPASDSQPRTLEFQSVRGDGTLIPIRSSSVYTEFDGEPARIVMFHDQALRMGVEADLRRLADALEATMEGVAILRDERYVFVNPAHAAMYGYTVAEMLGQSWRMLYSPEEIRRLEAEAFPLLAAQGRWSGSTRSRRKDGSEISGDISLTFTPACDLICACRDNSARRRQEEAVRRSQEMLSWVLEATEDGTWDWDVPSGTVEFSDQWLALLGYRPGEMPDCLKTWSDRLHPEDRARVEQEVEKLLLPGSGNYHCEYRILHRDGTWRWIIDRGKVVARDRDGRALRAVGAHSDVTHRRQAELALEQRTRELLESNAGLARAAQVRDEFLARISHELRTPLTTILALVEMLLGNRQDPLSERQRRRLGTVQESGQHLVELIDEILDGAKLEAGTMKLSVERVSVRSVAEQAVRLVAPQAQRKELRLSFKPGPQFLAVDADALRLKQVLVNLLGNAVKFTPAGGEVRLGIGRSVDPVTGPMAELCIADTGIGIPAEQQASIFQPFVQLDSGLDRAYGGSGLGLFIVRHFTELMGGDVSLTSTPGQGTEFRVRLPETSADPMPAPGPDAAGTATAAAAAPASAPLPAGGAEASENPPWEILLVDDNQTNRSLVAEFLEDEGFTVRTAASGPAALDRLEAGKIGLAFVDVQMPGMDGLEVTRRIRAHRSPQIANTLVVGLTALAMAGDRERCLGAGMDSYLSKPFALSQLPALIRRLAAEGRAGGAR